MAASLVLSPWDVMLGWLELWYKSPYGVGWWYPKKAGCIPNLVRRASIGLWKSWVRTNSSIHHHHLASTDILNFSRCHRREGLEVVASPWPYIRITSSLLLVILQQKYPSLPHALIPGQSQCSLFWASFATPCLSLTPTKQTCLRPLASCTMQAARFRASRIFSTCKAMFLTPGSHSCKSYTPDAFRFFETEVLPPTRGFVRSTPGVR